MLFGMYADYFGRKNALMVLTHLILNDMVKVKGQISEMAICLEDADRRIADLAAGTRLNREHTRRCHGQLTGRDGHDQRTAKDANAR